MPSGFRTFTPEGRLQASSEYITYTVRKTGTATTRSRVLGNTTISSVLIPQTGMSARAFCAVQIMGYAASLVARVIVDGVWHWNFATNAPVGTSVNYYIFDRVSEISVATPPLVVRNTANQITFSAALRPMNTVGFLGNPADAPWSYIPTYYSEGSTMTLAGRSLAVFNGGWAGHRIAEGLHCQSSNPGPIGEPEECTAWGWFNNGKVYGGLITNGGATVTSVQITWDDVTASMSGDLPPPDFVTPLKMFVIDVTGIPVGATYY